MLHGYPVFVCTCVTLQECKYISCGRGFACTCSGPKEKKSMHYDGVACREAVVIREAMCTAI